MAVDNSSRATEARNMAKLKANTPRNLQLISKGRVRRPSQEQIRKALEQIGLSASQADDAAIYAARRVHNEAGPDDPRFWPMKSIVLAVVEHLHNQEIDVPEFPDYKLHSVVAGLVEEWDDLIPRSGIGGAA
jgi:hypothetical protein